MHSFKEKTKDQSKWSYHQQNILELAFQIANFQKLINPIIQCKLMSNTQSYIGTREVECQKLKSKYPDRIPIIIEKSTTSKLPDLDKDK